MHSITNVSRRNLFGALLGSITGLLLFWYFQPSLLPIGVLAGWVIGWAGDLIMQSAVQTWHRLIALLSATKSPTITGGLFGHLATICRGLSRMVDWIISRPSAYHNWISNNPKAQVGILRLQIVFVISTIGLALIIWYQINHTPTLVPTSVLVDDVYQKVMIAPTMGYYFPRIFLLAAYLILPYWAFLINVLDRENKAPKHLAETLALYTQVSRRRFFFLTCRDMGFFQLRVYRWYALRGLYFITTIILMATVLVLPILVLLSGFKALQKVTSIPSFWLGLVVTLGMTSLSAWQLQTYFNHELILWSVAITSGVVSFMLTETLRRGVYWLITKTREGSYLRNHSFGELFKPPVLGAWSIIMDGWNLIPQSVRAI